MIMPRRPGVYVDLMIMTTGSSDIQDFGWIDPATGNRYNPCVDYAWDEAKAAANFAKHRVSFTAAALALDDPRKIECIDDRFDYREERIQNICMGSGQVLFVVTVMRNASLCRIISARKATRHERELYFEDGPLFP